MQIKQDFNVHQLIQTDAKDRAHNLERIKQKHIDSGNREFSQMMLKTQSFVEFKTDEDNVKVNHEEFQAFLKDIGYEGPGFSTLSQKEASELVSENGFFGVQRTAERIANFVIHGSGEDESLLRAGRDGILQGFKEAEAIWGDKLPKISYQTIEKAVEIIDAVFIEKGYSLVDKSV